MPIDWPTAEKKWQGHWDRAKIGEATVDPSRPKFFIIFAYPGVSGYLHVGHMRGYTYADVIARYKHMKGFNVLFPAGFHASGLHSKAIAAEVARGKKERLDYFRDAGLDQKTIESFKDYTKVLEYFYAVYEKEYWRKFGFLIDWRRICSTLGPGYARFIQWQFKKLRDAEMLVQKPYQAAFCPRDGPVAVDPSETDLKRGGKAEKLEYVALKFAMGKEFLVAATLRPETVYGQTNMWVAPDAEYVRADVDGEKWILSPGAAKSLEFQGHDVKVTGKVSGRELVGKRCKSTMGDRDLLILPAKFVDAAVGTGIVTSVPSDAPYDWQALEDLRRDKKECEEYGLRFDEVKRIAPIHIIKTKGYDDVPAKALCEKAGVKDQSDEKLEALTQELYAATFHSGVMAAGAYSGQKVSDAKEKIKADLLREKRGVVFFGFSEPVVCRCGEDVVIKNIPDQWFIKYSDLDVTQKAKVHSQEMTIIPAEYKEELPRVLDWFEDRPCVRMGSWLGTKFPFDEKWVVEPISDSTLYPMYYIVSLYENAGLVTPDDMTDKFFDYVFLKKGEARNEMWERVAMDFEYWYPLDLNLGGKEHKTVHFPVFIMNHVAVLPGEQWPRGIFVNWWVTGRGGKISKSKGGAEPIPGAIEKFSVDGMRLYYSHIASGSQDIEWDEDVVFNYKAACERIYSLMEQLLEKGRGGHLESSVDQWLVFNVNQRLLRASAAMEGYDLRTAADEVFYGMHRDLQWYKRRGGANRHLIEEALRVWCRMMNPFTPHLAEEAWHSLLGEARLVQMEFWPGLFKTEVSGAVNLREKLVENVLEDVRGIVKIVGKQPRKVSVFTAAAWKWKALEIARKNEWNFSNSVKQASNEIRQHAKEAAPLVKFFVSRTGEYRDAGQFDEFATLAEATEFFSQELGCGFEARREEDSGHEKARKAVPLKPGIQVDF
jgi:leucyl-tRNA synthetase